MDAKPFANTKEFCAALGWFYAIWSSTELNIDCIIGKLKGTPPEQTHALLAGLKFSGKLKLLRSLLSESGLPNVAELNEFLERIENDTLRNTFAHSFLASDPDSVTFVHRKLDGNKYSCIGYRFAAGGFFTHVQNFAELSHDFEKALGFSRKEIGEFASWAIKEEKPG